MKFYLKSILPLQSVHFELNSSCHLARENHSSEYFQTKYVFQTKYTLYPARGTRFPFAAILMSFKKISMGKSA